MLKRLRNKPLIAVLAILIVGGFLFFSQLSSSETIDCSKPNILVNKIVQILPSDVKYKVTERDPKKYHSSYFTVSWKRNSSEPFITYNGENSWMIEFSDSSGSLDYSSEQNKIKNNFDDKIDKKLAASGFTKNPFNTLKTSPGPQFRYSYEYGYKKGDEIYSIVLGNGTIGINCGKIDNELDSLYTELLASPTVKQEIQTTNSPVAFSIKKIHRNNIVEGSIYTENVGAGYSLWLIKENGLWNKLYTGQQSPNCNLLENKGVESGVECAPSVWNGSYTKTR